MISRVGLAICVIGSLCVWLCCVAPASCDVDPLPQIILAQQSQYIQSIASLELQQVVTVTVNEALRKLKKQPSAEVKQEGCIVVDGARHFSEVKLESGDTIASAFDGNNYETRSGRTLAISKTSPNNNPYLGWTVLTAPFAFAFADDDELSLEALRNPELWARVLKEVVSAGKASMLGHEGTLLKFTSPDSPDKAVEAFFAEDLGQLPIYVKVTRKDTISEMTVLDTSTISGNGTALVVATRVSLKDCSLDKVYEQECVLEVDTETLKVNQPMNQNRFTLPRTNVKVINYADFDLLVPAS